MKEIYAICARLIMRSLDVDYSYFLYLIFFLADESCVDCSSDSLYYVKFIGFFALRVAAVGYSIKVNLNKVSGKNKRKSEKEGEDEKKNTLNPEDFQSNLMKVVVNFLQVSSIIFLYRFDWPDFVTKSLFLFEIYFFRL